MEQSKSLRRKKVECQKLKKYDKHIHNYIDEKLDELSWNMGKRKIRNREELYAR